MAVRVLGVGVLIRLATEAEVEAAERARHGGRFELEPSRSHGYHQPDRGLARDEVYVVSQAFVDFARGGADERWVSFEHHGRQVSVVEDATLDLLELAEATAQDDLIDLLADMRIANLGVSRWELMSAPRRIVLEPELQARLAPLRRG